MVNCCSAQREKNTTKTKTHLCACLWILLIYTAGTLRETLRSICGRMREQSEEPTCHICPVLHIHTKWRRLSNRCHWNNHEILRFTFHSCWHLKLGGGRRHLSWIFCKSHDKQSRQPALNTCCQKKKKKRSAYLKTPLIRYNCIDKAPEESYRGPSWHPSTLRHTDGIVCQRMVRWSAVDIHVLGYWWQR